MKRLRIEYVLVSLVLALLLVSGAGCELFPGVVTPTPTLPENTPTSPINPAWTPPAGNQSSLLPNIADVVAKVRPSVVAINTEFVTFDIFNRPSTQRSAGSGWIIDGDGLIVTNNHVVEDAKTVTVTLSDNREFTAEKVSTDPIDDIAVIKINAGGLLPAAAVGDTTNLRVGDWVVAVGNPLGLGISAKEGIASRLGVSVTVSSGQTLYDLIETSAAINPGNSGGPLVNMAGEVIGITSIKIAELGVEGLGYAININAALPIINELVATGRVVRPWLGVVLMSVNQTAVTRFGLAVDYGSLVTEVARGSPADKAGLRQGDVIIGFNGKDIKDTTDLVQAIRGSKIGQTVEIVYYRGTNRQTTQATLAENRP